MRYCYLLISFSLLISCSSSKKATLTSQPDNLVADGKLWSSLFQQRAAEYKALCMQAFNIAKLRLADGISEKKDLPFAIVTDVDETFLDNSPYAVHQALQGKDYESDTWADWTAKGEADTLSGALSFFNYAAANNVEVFYVTNRSEKERAGTLLNLIRYKFPYADSSHLILRKAESSKEPRRQEIAKSHEILLFLGDNLADFNTQFDDKKEDERDRHVKELAAEFGKKYIVFPNTNYGGWENAIYQNKRNWSPAQKDSLIRTVLKNY